MGIKELQEAAEKAQTVAKTLKEQVDSASDDDKEALQKAYEKHVIVVKDTVDALEKAVKEASEQARVKKVMDAAKALTETQVPDTSFDGEGNPAQPRDAFAAEMDKHKSFKKFMDGESMTTGEYSLLAPRSAVKSGKNPTASIPITIMARMFPGVFEKAMDPGLRNFWQRAIPMQSDDNDAAGGRANLVVPTFETTLQKLPSDNPSLFERVTKKSMSGGSLVAPRLLQVDDNEHGGADVQWVNEEADAPETEIDFEQLTIQGHPVKAFTSATNVLLSRSIIDFSSEVAENLRAAMTQEIDRVIMHGTGTAQPLGIRQEGDVRQVTRQTAGAVGYDDLVNLMGAVQSYHRQGATYALGDDVHLGLLKETDLDGRPIFAASTANGAFDRLVNWPWFTTERASDIGTIGDIVFGNLMHYWLAIEQEITIARSDEFLFRVGGVAWRIDALIGGRPFFPRAFSILTGLES